MSFAMQDSFVVVGTKFFEGRKTSNRSRNVEGLHMNWHLWVGSDNNGHDFLIFFVMT
jgi:hypothetical protein